MSEYFGFAFTCVVVIGACMVVLHLQLPRTVKELICIAVILRIVGAVLYYATFNTAAYGGGDYSLYFEVGTDFARRMAKGDFTRFTDPSTWWSGKGYGTQFVCKITAVRIRLIGPSSAALLVLFSMPGFLRLAG